MSNKAETEQFLVLHTTTSRVDRRINGPYGPIHEIALVRGFPCDRFGRSINSR